MTEKYIESIKKLERDRERRKIISRLKEIKHDVRPEITEWLISKDYSLGHNNGVESSIQIIKEMP